MNTITIECPHCGKRGDVPEAARGREIGCKACGKRFAAVAVSAKLQPWDADEEEKAARPINWRFTSLAIFFVLTAVIAIGSWLSNDNVTDAILHGVFILLCVFGAVAAVAIYLAPIVVAMQRKHRNTPAIAALTIVGGWTIILWGAALAWALYNPPEQSK